MIQAAMKVPRYTLAGRVIGIRGSLIVAQIPLAGLGHRCEILIENHQPIDALVTGFSEDVVFLAPFAEVEGIRPGTAVRSHGLPFTVTFPADCGGLVIDCLGNVLGSSKPERTAGQRVTTLLAAPPPPALDRKPIRKQLVTGIRSIDGLSPLGHGQRMGLFAGAGVGKSTLVGAITRSADVDLTVIALVGERGREVNEFLNDSLGENGLARSIVVVATSDESAVRRVAAAQTATAIAEYHRSQGKQVLLVVDSLTRTARALRDIGIARGELPLRAGFPASVYAELPRLLERAGNDSRGSITALYAMLTEGEGLSDPLSHEVKSILDGHLILEERVAQQGIRPAIDILRSLSRLTTSLFSADQQQTREVLIRIAARISRDRDLVLLGGTPDPELRAALTCEAALCSALNQKVDEKSLLEDTIACLAELAHRFQEELSRTQPEKITAHAESRESCLSDQSDRIPNKLIRSAQRLGVGLIPSLVEHQFDKRTGQVSR